MSCRYGNGLAVEAGNGPAGVPASAGWRNRPKPGLQHPASPFLHLGTACRSRRGLGGQEASHVQRWGSQRFRRTSDLVSRGVAKEDSPWVSRSGVSPRRRNPSLRETRLQGRRYDRFCRSPKEDCLHEEPAAAKLWAGKHGRNNAISYPTIPISQVCVRTAEFFLHLDK